MLGPVAIYLDIICKSPVDLHMTRAYMARRLYAELGIRGYFVFSSLLVAHWWHQCLKDDGYIFVVKFIEQLLLEFFYDIV